MSGLYIHIPFCKQACSYCDFHFSTSLKMKSSIIESIMLEMDWRKTFIDAPLESIYFGGGTPSVLSISDWSLIFNQIENCFDTSKVKEITIEANPDDLSDNYLSLLKNFTPINRLSIGIQSFDDGDLVVMNRSHDSYQAMKCLEQAQKLGFESYSLDLIYGIPTSSHEIWEENLRIAKSFNPPHISAYCLTVEERTSLHYKVKNNQYPKPSSEYQMRQFDMLVDSLEASNYEHYEISNFCRDENYAVHNTNYWNQKKYLGIGPSAHSFDGENRYWNIANNAKYIKAISAKTDLFGKEALSLVDSFNEYLMTRLRTQWGVENDFMKEKYPLLWNKTVPLFSKFITSGHVVEQFGNYFLTKEGRKISDFIISDLFWVE